ncbi:MAG: hypothetical protein K0M49_06985 [Arenimonas sp.]|nr:hypothetical protein [Arenimonas sp.]
MFGLLDLPAGISIRGQRQNVVISQIDKGGGDFVRTPSRSSAISATAWKAGSIASGQMR